MVRVDGLGGCADHMVVDPEHLERLAAGFEEEYRLIVDWIARNRNALRFIDPPGADPCSRDTVEQMGRLGGQAIEKCAAYSATLLRTAQKLRETATAYAANEDVQRQKFQMGAS